MTGLILSNIFRKSYERPLPTRSASSMSDWCMSTSPVNTRVAVAPDEPSVPPLDGSGVGRPPLVGWSVGEGSTSDGEAEGVEGSDVAGAEAVGVDVATGVAPSVAALPEQAANARTAAQPTAMRRAVRARRLPAAMFPPRSVRHPPERHHEGTSRRPDRTSTRAEP